MEDVFSSGERNHHISNTAYPIAHDKTWGKYRVPVSNHLKSVEQSFSDLKDISLYSHIPFCETRCYFCEYTVVGKSELDRTKEYMSALSSELKLYRNLLGNKTLHGLDIGGGTPSFVEGELIAEHVQEIKNSFDLAPDFEISIETTPKIAAQDPNKSKIYRDAGIERISMGLQVTQPDLLKLLGREENGVEHHFQAVDHIRKAGFKKFNIDLMYGFADQSLASWEATLLHCISLSPEYVTLYRMRYKLTRISHQASSVEMDSVRAQSKMAKEILKAHGYFANPGKNTFSKVPKDTGTSAYLTRRVIQGMPYLGIGLGAQTYTDNTISYNSGSVGKNLSPYFRALEENKLPIQDLYHLPAAHIMAKMIAVSFYFGEINLTAFYEKFGISLEEAYPEAVSFVLQKGLMEYHTSSNGEELFLKNGAPYPKESLSLTEEGAKYFNGTIALFFAPSVQGYLIDRNPETAEDMHKNRKLAETVANR
ncbi:coproporphyrinogen-III oxidase family protein [Leptospira idonii]|uniref:Radical SAM protein n=1 Tax=Leptospira idonii TaxID=1193500 RepID=A0A4R9M4M6_9LEPT|nr:radical SAM protein [Leptospira idonii]TGN20199.1 radical SAM protein [Leptospira idonii]